jgi:hypothetical protein
MNQKTNGRIRGCGVQMNMWVGGIMDEAEVLGFGKLNCGDLSGFLRLWFPFGNAKFEVPGAGTPEWRYPMEMSLGFRRVSHRLWVRVWCLKSAVPQSVVEIISLSDPLIASRYCVSHVPICWWHCARHWVQACVASSRFSPSLGHSPGPSPGKRSTWFPN